jgi:hypothetical protein
MKTVSLIFVCLVFFAGIPQAQNNRGNQDPMYRDITTGQPMQLRYNQQDQMMYNQLNNQPVDFFINRAGDTISSRGFYIVNDYLVRGNDQKYSLDTAKVQTRGEKLWSTRDDRELKTDENRKSYQKSPAGSREEKQ